MTDRRVLVIGTTTDYITYLHGRYPGRMVFVTDHAEQASSPSPRPDRASEIFCDLGDHGQVQKKIFTHLKRYSVAPSGVVCFDCEQLVLAARIAAALSLDFPSVETIELCRNKHLTRQAWHSKNVRCPQSRLIHTGVDALRYFSELKKPLVLKPLTGSGSELTFSCADEYELVKAFDILKDGLEQRKQSKMYYPPPQDAGGEEPRPGMAAEEFISGREYSCDFLIDGPELRLIRMAKKMPGHGLPFGTTLAYTVPAQLPGWLDRNTLRNKLRGAARALGITRAICMVDFIVTRDDVVFLEMTPRLGGDCLPRLVWHGCGLDVLALALDFAEGGTVAVPPAWQWRHVVGLKLFATIPGRFHSMCTDRLTADSRVLELGIRWVPGHEVVLPPQDYDSWLLGHVIFKPDENIELERQCDDLRGKLIVQMETTHVQDLSGNHGAGRQITGTADTAT